MSSVLLKDVAMLPDEFSLLKDVAVLPDEVDFAEGCCYVAR